MKAELVKLDPDSQEPVYAQIVQEMRTLIMMKKLHAHEQIASVRAMAKHLGINPNTVQKAYKLLKQEGLIYPKAGRGDFVCEVVVTEEQDVKKDELVEIFRQATLKARDLGMWIEDIFTIVDDAYSGK